MVVRGNIFTHAASLFSMMLLTEREIEFSFSVFEYDCTTNQRHSSECKCNTLGLGSTYSFNSNTHLLYSINKNQYQEFITDRVITVDTSLRMLSIRLTYKHKHTLEWKLVSATRNGNKKKRLFFHQNSELISYNLD